MDGLFDTAPCGVLSLGTNGTILRVNRTLAQWLGYEASELEGRSIETVLSIGGRIFFQTHISPLLNLQGRADEIYFSLKRKDGKPLPVLANAVRHERAGILVNDCVFLPMHQRRQYEDELLQAKKIAEEATHAKARFLSMMSHELRTPMNAILGFGQLLQKDKHLNALQSESAEHIVKAGRHLLELINEVLDLARIEANGLDVELEPVSVAEVTREALDMARPLANKAGITLQMQPGLQDLWVNGDPKRLRQILLNLLANAIKYNRPQGLVTLKCQRGIDWPAENDNNSEMLRLSVTDTGPGIAPDKLDKLFIPFERLGAEGGEIEGTGLGLALCKRLTEAMNGRTGVESVMGEGSSFWIEFPITSPPLQLAPAAGEAEAVVGTRLSSTTQVLYIEDNAPNLQLMERILGERPAVQLLAATTGAAGLQLARTHCPHLILLDLQLPDMNGDVVLQHLQGEKKTSGIPVIVLSADAMPHQVERLLKAGARHYLTKPLDVSELLNVVDALLERQSQHTNPPGDATNG